MDCPTAQDRLSAWLDGALDAAEASAVSLHVDACGECRQAADAARLLEADLRRAFAPQRRAADAVARAVIARLPAEGRAAGSLNSAAEAGAAAHVPAPRGAGQPEASRAPGRRGAWWLPPLAAGIAAGFLAAVFVFRPWVRQTPIVVQGVDRPIARLALATGPVEVRPAGGSDWGRCDASEAIVAGAAVRTAADGRCEIATDDGRQVRLNGDTHVRFEGADRLYLEGGQLWSAAGDRPLQVKASDVTISAGDAQFDVHCTADETVVTVLQGSAVLQCPQDTLSVPAGEAVKVAGGRVVESGPALDPLLATAWVLDLAALRGPDDAEFAARLDAMLARIGEAKLHMLYEEEIRRLGDRCVLPLVRYIQSTAEAEQDHPRRAAAARIVADVAEPRSIGELVALLSDPDADVRARAAEGLARLTGRDEGMSPDQWATAAPAACQTAQAAWQQWWDANRHRYQAP